MSYSSIKNQKPASLIQRTSAWCWDLLPFQLIWFVFQSNDPSIELQIEVGLIIWVLYAGYHIVFETLFQTTPGKYLVGLKVIDSNQKFLDWRKSWFRFLASSLSWITLNIGHILIHYRQDKASLHDLLTQTQVIEDTKIRFWDFPKLSSQNHHIAMILGLSIQILIFLWGFIQIWIDLNQVMIQLLAT